ncbi:hypothetical protein ACFQL0_02800 [Haloplanus litoreus]|uniref:hypothetical protein n=1 Tax=Haloplanus litoreus TaxID=767515 RepID=UPI0036151894
MPTPGSLSQSYTIRSPAHVEYGTGAIDALEPFASDRDADTALLVTDEHLAESGVVDAPVLASKRRAWM